MKSLMGSRRSVIALCAVFSLVLSFLVMDGIAGGMFRVAAEFGFHP